MNLQEFINESWNNHDKETKDVANNLKENLHLIKEESDIPSYLGPVVHVLGGHLGKWNEVLEVIEKLDQFKDNQSILRAKACSYYCLGDTASFKNLTKQATEHDSLLKVFSMAANELVTQDEIEKAKVAYSKALEHIPTNLTKENTAARSIAITSNNLAVGLEEKENPDTQLMLSAAHNARKYWEIAGGWMEIERAEYRLAMSYLKANDFKSALIHARKCEEICLENSADEFELFFAYEALTKVNRAMCVSIKNQVQKDYQEYCIIP